ncbi:type I restriction enzyme S subunit [Tenacibaculum skagerrakense]|uniref:Type I restriction enzyme S subunit n=1 Tax=Tenacibaculum skagerrakense TaxID=186571 RepID=A0A4R2NT91_9FLAO|nr:restriction endonuclease subunit S [Tenacibaculum skagerrakense]TCP25203.1 type I restriction enzyme S subunit [Tenacibaculum skagerrakense]
MAVVEERAGYKKTKLGWIPELWGVEEIGKYANIQTGNKDTKDKEENGKFPFFVRSQKVARINTFSFNGEAVLTSGDGVGVGKDYHYIQGKFDYHQRVYALTDFDEDLYGKYFYYYFSCFFYRRVYRLSAKNSVDSVRMEMIQKMNLPIPPIQEQKAIANCLSTWDTAIEKQTQLIQAKQTQKKALMQQLLTGKKRLPGFIEEWEEYKFNEIVERVTRKNKELDDTVVTISAQRGFVLQEDFFNKRVASKTLSNYTLVHKGEFCYNKSYSKGYPMGAFKRLDDFEKAVVTTLYICFKLKKNVNSDFMNQYFNGGRMIKGLMRIAQEGGRAHGLLNISLPDFFNLKVMIPEKKEQTAIANILNTADKEIELLQAQLTQLQQQKKGLMQQLLTGKKRLKY